MGCNCGKRKREREALAAGSGTTYVLRLPDGSVSEHGSKLEAQAANARAGGGGKVTTK